MSKIIHTNQTTPATPTTGKTAQYINSSTKTLETVDDAGLVTTYTSSLTGLLKANNLSDVASASTSRTNLGLGTAAVLDSDTDVTLAANSDTKLATQKAVKTYVDTVATGLLDFKGSTDCSANPDYPAALKGDAYAVLVAGKIGGASGASVDIGDVYVASADNAGGTQAAVGTSWFILEHNLQGALLSANDLSDLASASTARTNLGLGSLATLSSLAHSALTGLTSGDDHTQYALLAGRSGGQSLIGGTASGNNLTLSSTSNATKGKVIFGSTTAYDEVNDRFGIGTASPTAKLHVVATTEQQRLAYDASNYMTATVSSVGVVTFDAVGSGSTSFAFSDRMYSGLPSSLNDFRVGTTSTWTQTTGSYGAFSGQINANPTASSTAIIYGTHMEVGVSSSNAQNLTGAQALIGIRTGCQHRGSGVVTGMVNFFAATAGFSSTGTITNSYGLWINPQVTAGVTNGYGVYQSGTSDRNYFGGSIAVGFTTAPTAKVQFRSTTEQLRVEYDASNYYSTTVGSTGGVTFDAVGTGARFTFSDRVNIPTSTPASAAATGTAGDVTWDADFIYICTASNTWKRVAIATW